MTYVIVYSNVQMQSIERAASFVSRRKTFQTGNSKEYNIIEKTEDKSLKIDMRETLTICSAFLDEFGILHRYVASLTNISHSSSC